MDYVGHLKKKSWHLKDMEAKIFFDILGLMTRRNNKPIWMILILITLGVLGVLFSHVIQLDTETDERFMVEVNP